MTATSVRQGPGHPSPLSTDPDRRPTRPAADAAGVARVRASTARRRTRVLALLVLALVGALAVRVMLGDYTIALPDLVRILTGTGEVPAGAEFILLESKLPRAVAGTLAGLALGASGATFQLMARNPLASPDVLGLTMGASAAAVTSLVVFGLSGSALVVAALIGAALVAVALLVLSGNRSGGAPTRMILVGVALSAMLTSCVHWVLLRADIYRAHEAMVWLTGSLNGVTWSQIGMLAGVVVLTLPVLLATADELHLVELGDDVAHGVGASPRPVRTRALALVVILVGATTAVCGPIAFVAFLSGPIARRLRGGRADIAAAALVGAVVVVLADHLGAYALPGSNLPVGVVTGLVGAPFLLWLLTRAKGA